MLKLLLVRAGATEYASQGRVQGTLDIPLSEDGRQAVESAVDQLPAEGIETLYSAPGRSSQQTATIIGDTLDLKVKTLDKLQNLNQGLWQGMLIQDVKEKQPKVYRQWQEHPETVCPPEGESLQNARQRVELVLAKMVKKHKSGCVAVVVPEPLYSVLRNLLTHDQLGDLWKVEANGRALWETIEIPARATQS